MNKKLWLHFAIACFFATSSQCGNSQTRKQAPARIGEYIVDQSVWMWLQQGMTLCYNHNNDGTCTLVEYPSGIGDNNGLILQLQYAKSAGGGIKISTTQRLQRRSGGNICTVETSAYYDSVTYYQAASNSARIDDADEQLKGEAFRDSIEDLKRKLSQSFGRETCYRFYVTKISTDGKYQEVQEHAFIDGVRQRRRLDSRITTFDSDFARNNLHLRPGEP